MRRTSTRTPCPCSANLDSVVLAKLDGDSDDPLDEDVDFTFEDFDILTPFTKF